MRLLNIDTFSLEDFFHETVPPYAILSHTWGKDHEELSFQDVVRDRYKNPGSRPAKVRGCCEQARRDGYLHVWIDTCCIDKTNAVELQEAINSMFRWYQNAAICYAYLSDVSSGNGGSSEHQAADRGESTTAGSLAASRWFTRGWTLQELLAPHDMRFYDSTWQLLGTKGELCSQIHSITGIPPMILLGITDMRSASVAQRMSWAAKRVTKRNEDMAYCLLGVFGVTMPMIYGEGGDKAFRRLQEQIMKDVKDDSILAWGCQLPGTDACEEPAKLLPGRLLATSPADFAKCGDILTSPQLVITVTDLFAGRLKLRLPVVESETGRTYGLLSSHCGYSSNLALGIPLMKVSGSESTTEYARPHGFHARLVPKLNASEEGTLARAVSIHIDSPDQLPLNDQGQYWYWIQNPVQEIRLVEVEPASLWRKERALIEAKSHSRLKKPGTITGLTVLRFRANETDFVLVLDLDRSQETASVRYSLMTALSQTNLSEIMVKFRSFRAKARESLMAGFNLKLGVSIETVASQKMFVIRMKKEAMSITLRSFDAHGELRLLDLKTAIETAHDEENRLGSDVARITDALKVSDAEGEKRKARLKALDESIERLEHERAELRKASEEDERKRVEHSDLLNQVWQDQASNSLHLRLLLIEETLSRKDEHEFTSTDDLVFEPGQSPLSWAAAHGRENIVNLFLRRGADVEARSGSGRTPLSYAARNGHGDIVRLLLQQRQVVPDSVDAFGRTPLMHAATNGHSVVVDLLLDTGRIDINRRDQMGWTALAHAAANGDMPTFGPIARSGGDLTSVDLGGKTILSLAAARGDARMVDYILSHEPRLHLQKDRKGWTPLAYAVLNGYNGVVSRLLREMKDGKAEILNDDKLVSALFRAASTGRTHAVVEVLVHCGNISELRDGDGRSLLTCAAAGGGRILVDFLLRVLDADPNHIDGLQQTPLNWACMNGHLNVVTSLLEDTRTDPNCVGKTNETALIWAARNGHDLVVQRLLDTGRINVDVKDSQAKTALQWAVDNADKLIVNKLQHFILDSHLKTRTPIR